MQLHSLAQIDKLARQFAAFAESPMDTWGSPLVIRVNSAHWQVQYGQGIQWTLKQDTSRVDKTTFEVRPDSLPKDQDGAHIEATFGIDHSVKELIIGVVSRERSTKLKQILFLVVDFDADTADMCTFEGTGSIHTRGSLVGNFHEGDFEKSEGQLLDAIRYKTPYWMLEMQPQPELVAVAG